MTTRHSAALERQAREIAARLRGIEGLEAVVLFGSVARGEADEWSDCDLALIGTERGCATARRRLPDELGEVPLEVVELSQEGGYNGLGVWGKLGSEVVHTGTVLWGRGTVERLRREEMVALDAKDVRKRMGFILGGVAEAAQAWTKQRKGTEGGLERAAVTSANAAEHLVKLACTVRGRPARHGHTIREVVGWAMSPEGKEEARSKAIPMLVKGTQEDIDGYLEAMAGHLNGEGRTDHLAGYFEEDLRLEEESAAPRIGKRMGHLLWYAQNELQLLNAVPGMDGLEESLRDRAEDIKQAVQELADDPAWEVRRGARAWSNRARGRSETPVEELTSNTGPGLGR